MQIGHQLLANIEATDRARRDAIQVEESRRAEVARLKEKAAKVVTLQEALEKEKQALEKEKQTSEETVRKAEAEVANIRSRSRSWSRRLGF